MQSSRVSLFLVVVVACSQSFAQISEGGQPLSRIVNNAQQHISKLILPLPDLEAIRKEDSIKMQNPLEQFHIGS